MAAIDIQSQGEPSASTVSAVLDAAAERLAAAGIESARADAEALVADAMGVKPRGALGRQRRRDLARGEGRIEEKVARRVEREPMAYVLGRAPFRNLEIAVDPRVLWPRRETELLVEVAAELPQGARVHEVGTGSGAIALALMSASARTSRSPPRTSRRRRSKRPARTPSGSGSSSTSASPQGIPDDLDGVDLVIANLPYVTDSTIFERSPEIQREPRIAVTGDCGEDGLGVIRGLIEETPSGWRMAMEHDTHHGAGDARTAARRDYPSGL